MEVCLSVINAQVEFEPKESIEGDILGFAQKIEDLAEILKHLFENNIK